MSEEAQNRSSAEKGNLQLRRLSPREIQPVEDNQALGQHRPGPRAGLGWGQCTNYTGETLLVYGPKSPGSVYDDTIYCLPSGYNTPDNWDCDGFFVPADRIADQFFSKLQGPLAIKYYDFMHFVITSNAAGEYQCGGNVGAYRAGEINWQIPAIDSTTVEIICV
jgi:hypothetical protein